MTKNKLLQRYMLFVFGLMLEEFGVAFSKHGDLGVSPISSVPNVVSFMTDRFSLGNLLIIWNTLLIVLQILLLRKDFQIKQLLQVPLSFLFGWFTDLGLLIVRNISVNSYLLKLMMVIIGMIFTAFGIVITVKANVILNSGEAVVKIISDLSGKAFGNIKVIFDCSCVISALIVSIIYFHGKIMGIREGTVILAVCTGVVVKFITRTFDKFTVKSSQMDYSES